MAGNVSATIQSWCQIDRRDPAATEQAITGSSNPHYSLTLPVAIEGELTTRTSDTAGTVTTDAAHGLAGTETIAIFWTDSGIRKCAYNATVSSKTTNTVTFSGAAGDVLPAGPAGTGSGTTVRVAVAQLLDDDVHIPGGVDLLCLQLTTKYEGLIVLMSDGGTGADVVQLAEIVTSTAPHIWPIPNDAASEFSADICSIAMYNYDSTNTSTGTVDAVGA